MSPSSQNLQKDRLNDISIAEQDGVGYVSFSRPRILNAARPQTYAELRFAVDTFAEREDIGAVVLRGEGSSFCAGADLSAPDAHRTPSVNHYLEELRLRELPIFESLRSCPKPILASVAGHAVGSGFLIALHCDIILAAESTKFSLPQVSLGLIPAYGGLSKLSRSVGSHRAFEIALTGRVVSGAEAASIGIASDVVADEELPARTAALAKQLRELPGLAIKMCKESLIQSEEEGIARVAAYADKYRFMALTLTDDSLSRHASWRANTRNAEA